MRWSSVLCLLCLLCANFSHAQGQSGAADRAYSVQVMQRIALPVLTALSQNKLRQTMPVEGPADRAAYTHLEAAGRLLAGMAPWLELGPDNTPEGQLRAQDIRLAVQAISHAADPSSPDFMNFDKGSQPLVDTAFSLSPSCAPRISYGEISVQRTRPMSSWHFKKSRVIHPFESNWLLFSATIEAAVWEFTGECN